MKNMRAAVSGLNRYKIALSEGNTMCKLRFPECVSGQLAVAVSEVDNPQKLKVISLPTDILQRAQKWK